MENQIAPFYTVKSDGERDEFYHSSRSIMQLNREAENVELRSMKTELAIQNRIDYDRIPLRISIRHSYDPEPKDDDVTEDRNPKSISVRSRGYSKTSLSTTEPPTLTEKLCYTSLQKSSNVHEEAENLGTNTPMQLDLTKITAREWFALVDAQLVKEVLEETEKLIESMRGKALRVEKYIAEQLEAKRRKV